MARRQKRGKKNTWLWYGLYAVAGYYAYSYLTGKPLYIPFVNQNPLPEPTVSAFPNE